MALSNSERIGKGLDLLKDGLIPFVERELKAEFKSQWQESASRCVKKGRDWKVADGEVQWDVYLLLTVMVNN